MREELVRDDGAPEEHRVFESVHAGVLHNSVKITARDNDEYETHLCERLVERGYRREEYDGVDCDIQSVSQ